MDPNSDGDIGSYSAEERTLAEGFAGSVYDTLLRLARTRRRRAGFRDTMMTEDLLHESFLKLSGRPVFQSPEHFLRSAVLAMRQVVIDHARKQLTAKRGKGDPGIPIDQAEDLLPDFGETPEQLVIINDLLRQLEAENPRWLRIVDARYFAGMTEAETAAVLGLSERTVRRDWQAARAWLAERMGAEG